MRHRIRVLPSGMRSGSRTLVAAALSLVTSCCGTVMALPLTATPTDTPTNTPTATPTSCRGDPPVVEPVTSPTNLLEQTIHFCGRIVGSSSMGASSDAGAASDVTSSGPGSCALPCPHEGNATCNQATVPLLPNQVNHITVCQINQTCQILCVTVDGNGSPLEIRQGAAPTASATPTPSSGPPIPVIAAPTTPSGIVMIALLGIAMAWVLWRPKASPPAPDERETPQKRPR